MYAMHIQKSTMQDNFRFAIQNFVFRAKVYIPKNYKHLKKESRIASDLITEVMYDQFTCIVVQHHTNNIQAFSDFRSFRNG